MEIQHGKGPWADPVAGIVPLGTTLTMVVGINDKLGEYWPLVIILRTTGFINGHDIVMRLRGQRDTEHNFHFHLM